MSKFNGPIVLPVSTTAVTPGAGTITFYIKSDGYVYTKDSSGTETKMGGAAGANVVTSTNPTAPKLTISQSSSPPSSPVENDIWIVTDIGEAPVTTSDMVENYARTYTAMTNSEALSKYVPSLGSPKTLTPTITMGTSVDAATPTQIKSNTSTSTTALNPVFKLSGFNYTVAGGAFPDYEGVRSWPLAQLPIGFGNAAADFISDSPAISFKHSRSQLGTTRILVDGVEVLLCGSATRQGTAQAGSSSTITLDSGASAANGFYLGQWVRITSGTGSSPTQHRQITGYVGATKVATVSPNWSTAPDNTSVFEVTQAPMEWSNSTNTGSSTYFFKLDYNGERRPRHYRVESSGTTFYGCWVTSAIDSVYPANTFDSTPTIWCGDSFSAGTGGIGWITALSRIACEQLGWQTRNISIGGTGFLATGTNSLSFRDRLIPPYNSWYFWLKGSTAGTFTITQNGSTTATIAWNASIATIQSTLNTTFGAGNFYVAGDTASSYFVILGRNALAADTATLTADFTSLTGGLKQYGRWVGDLYPVIPRDGAGNAMRFNVVLAGIHNDSTDSNGTYTQSALNTEATDVINQLKTLYPTMTLYVIGMMFLPGGSVTSAGNNANAAGLSATTAAARKINNKVPYINPLSPAWVTGTGYPGSLQGNGNSDMVTWTDGLHPNPYGHYLYGTRIAEAVIALAASQ